MVSKNQPKTAEMRHEHDVQLRLLQGAEEALRRGLEKHEVEEIVSQLIEYTNVHFLSEQLLMRLYAYPDYGAHEQRHNEMTAQMSELQDRLGNDDLEGAGAVIASLSTCVRGHIEREDSEFAKFLGGRSQADG